MSQRWCRVCEKWHALEEPWPVACYGHFNRKEKSKGDGVQVIKDIEPYRNVIDKGVIGGRRQHRDFLRAHGCVEVGNEKPHLNPRKMPDVPGLREAAERAWSRHNP